MLSASLLFTSSKDLVVPDVSNMTVDEALDYIIEYSLKQQTVIQEYEARTDSLNKWVNEVKLKQKEIREKEKK